ncbi:MAG: exodeoxyribonuclease VII large subunit [Muribaculaceae bacterium]|nr:exodeoxyribonuclease VII large subunit [Muribaculaceae bacterium]
MTGKPISLLELTQRISNLVMNNSATQNVWITAELQDVACRGGHCYMELLQKDEEGRQVARIRGCCWAHIYGPLSRRFLEATGQQFTSGLKVMLRVSAAMHPVFGLSLVIQEANPEYTMGDLVRRRNEILLRLQQEGILEDNRSLRWPTVTQRVAVISAPGAAGYGDFMNQLINNPSRLKFKTRLFPAVMQGASAPASIIAALAEIAKEANEWDGVVIIRGGGATSDLQAFEDYGLAASVAQFPLPIAIGIGHERDVTVLDWVANMRLKTPTAVAEWLIGKGEAVLGALMAAGNKIVQYATQRISGDKEQLAQAEALLPVAARGAVDRSKGAVTRAATTLYGLSSGRIAPARTRLDMVASTLSTASSAILRRHAERLDASEKLLEVLSPAATLARGYSITRIDGHAVTSVNDVPLGALLEITLADGSFLAHTP